MQTTTLTDMRVIVFFHGQVAETIHHASFVAIKSARYATPEEIEAYESSFERDDAGIREAELARDERIASHIDGYDRDDLGESADY